jgi:sugar transferase (PEP-CTERM/EpsH1 system associated)
MRILFLTSRLPYPPDRGDRLRAYHFLKHLSAEHEMSLISFVAHDAEREHLAALRPFCQDVQTVPLSPRRSALGAAANAWRREPLQALYYRSPTMQRLVDETLATAAADGRPFAVVVAHLFRMAPYVRHSDHAYRIVDLTDVISQEVVRSLPYRGPVWRMIYRLEGPRIERYERWVAGTFDETWLISQADRQLLAGRCPTANIRVVPNGVDEARFFPTGEPCRPDRLIFVGHLGVFHNVDAALYLARDILPLVREQCPSCTLELVGAAPSSEVRSLAAEPGVTVTGFVPDLNRHLNQAAVFVAPLRFAAGVQNKVLEAMAAGRPVVTTSLVNAGLGAQAGRELLVADGATAIAGQVVALLRDGELRARIGQAALAFVHRTFRWEAVVRRLREVDELVRQSAPAVMERSKQRESSRS